MKEIIQFFEAVEKLKAENIIRSDKYLGEIGEFICEQTIGVKRHLVKN